MAWEDSATPHQYSTPGPSSTASCKEENHGEVSLPNTTQSVGRDPTHLLTVGQNVNMGARGTPKWTWGSLFLEQSMTKTCSGPLSKSYAPGGHRTQYPGANETSRTCLLQFRGDLCSIGLSISSCFLFFTLSFGHILLLTDRNKQNYLTQGQILFCCCCC